MTQEIIEKVFKIEGRAKLDVKNISGTVEIKPGKSDQINITAAIQVNSGDADFTRIAMRQSEDGVVKVHTRAERWPRSFFNFWRDRKVNYVIEVPSECSVKVRNIASSINISDLNGKFDLNTISGALNLRALEGDLRIHTVSGKVNGEALKGTAKFDTVSGVTELRNCKFLHLNCKTVSGKSLIATAIGEGPYRFKSVSGDITLLVSPETTASVRTKSISGRFKTSLHTTSHSSSGGRTKIELNGGGAKVRMSSVSGKLYMLTSDNDKAVAPHVSRPSKDERMAMLTRLETGDVSAADALAHLS